MSMYRVALCLFAALPLIGLAGVANGQTAPPAASVDPQQLADRIQQEVAAIRGLPFKRPVKAQTQSVDDFGDYLDQRIETSIPDSIAQHYGKIVKKLGLYRGPEITNAGSMMKLVATSQAAAYYDPTEQTFYVLVDDMPDLLRGTLYAHELYHGLQDQYFDISTYMRMDQRSDESDLNADELVARQAVIEGEATFVMNLWLLKSMTGSLPSPQMLTTVVQQQTNLDIAALRATLKQPQLAAMIGEDIGSAMETAETLPRFIIESMIGAYLKGLGFAHAVHAKGWSEVAKLYGEYPPASSEQILHPEKWFAREAPNVIRWPAFKHVRQLREWELLDENVLGELQWRSILKEHELADADTIAAGWNGDRYAVFKRKDSDALLLLLYTSWDSEAEAKEFADAYARLLQVKYAQAPEPTRLLHKGADVLIVEGGAETDLDALLKLVGKADKRRRS